MSASIAADAAPAAGRAAGRWLFVATILTGSFLLFLVQPMVARMALPRLGGAPAVWNSAMLVYQALLLGGYAYAHGIARLRPRVQAIIHGAVFVSAMAWLPIGLAGMAPPQGGEIALWTPWLLALSIGPLFFAVAAQAPLMQRWYGLSGGTGDPFALYAASNLGSFAGLFAYPLLVEPLMPLSAQSLLWSGLYGLLFALMGACALAVVRHAPATAAASAAMPDDAGPPSWRTMLRWIALAAVPSGLMLSTTSHLTTDLIAMPLIWAVPLGLYLLSFTVAFAENRTPAALISDLAPLVLLAGAAMMLITRGANVWLGFGASLAVLACVAVALHAEMYRTRPSPARLTQFYLLMSVGGMLGGLFCAILAPVLFDWTWEHPLLLLLAALLLPRREALFGGLLPVGRSLPTGTAAVLGLAALAAGIFAGTTLQGADSRLVWLAVVAIVWAAGVVLMGRRMPFAMAVLALLLAAGGTGEIVTSLEGRRERSYFGVYTVRLSEDGGYRSLAHGTTLHGIQSLRQPTRPTSYYGPTSGVGLALDAAPALYGPGARIGIVGLGAGTLACYRRPEQDWRFFEIDPLVVRIARDPERFTFLSDCAPGVPVVIGDARLSLADAAPGSLDTLAIDAFSSDAIPLHLLTAEAFDTYARALAPDGVLLVHISNRFMDLEPVITREAAARGWAISARTDKPDRELRARGLTPSTWLALARRPATLARLAAQAPSGAAWRTTQKPQGQRWTDSYASVLPLILEGGAAK